MNKPKVVTETKTYIALREHPERSYGEGLTLTYHHEKKTINLSEDGGFGGQLTVDPEELVLIADTVREFIQND